MNNKPLNNIISVIFIITVLAGTFIYIFVTDSLEGIISILKSTNYKWTFLGLILMFINILLDSVGLFIPLKKTEKDIIQEARAISLSTVLESNFIGLFFSYVTPFNTGGQPAQAFFLSKKGARMSSTLSILVIKSIIYQAALLSWAFILFCINHEFLFSSFSSYIWLIVLSILINLVVSITMIMTGRSKRFAEAIFRLIKIIVEKLSGLHLGDRHLIRNKEQLIKRTGESISNYITQFNETSCNIGTVFKMYITNMLQVLSYLTITYVIYQAFGNRGNSFSEILTIQIFLLLLIAYIPTPGAGLGAEGFFMLFFTHIFTSGLSLANLFWRLFTFYIPLIISGIITSRWIAGTESHPL